MFLLRRIGSTRVPIHATTPTGARRRHGLVMVAFGTAALGGLAYTPHHLLPSFLWKPAMITESVVRFMRSTATATVIAADYKWSLHNVPYPSDEYRAIRSKVHARCARRLLRLFERQTGIYIKLGQHIASLNHVLPSEYTSTMAVCQDKAPSQSFGAISRVFKDDQGALPHELFLSMDPVPFAAASLAQVHRAVTRNNEEVAVKVQYAGLREKIVGDLATLQFLTHLIPIVFPDFRFTWLIPEFRQNLLKELDFIEEGRNAEKTAHNLRNIRDIYIPKVHWSLTSRRILVMEFIHGCKVTDSACQKKNGFALHKVSALLNEAFCEQIFIHGFVHCDPHPGNVLVRANQRGNGPEVVLLDHGLYKELDESFREDYAHLWRALMLRDHVEIERYARRLGAGEFHELFSIMLTWRPSESAFIQSDSPSTKDDLARIRAKVQTMNVAKFSTFMEGIDRQLLFVLRTNNLLRSVNKEMGAPVNRFAIYARSSVRGIHRALIRGHRRDLSARLNYWRDIVSYAFRLQILTILTWGHTLFHMLTTWISSKRAEFANSLTRVSPHTFVNT